MKLRTGLLLGAAFLAGVAAGPDLGRLVAHRGLHFTIPALADEQPASGHAETFRLMDLFGDVFERVRAEYVEPVTDRTLINNALDGMLSGLDPHSAYMNEKEYADFKVQTTGTFGGLGLEVTEEKGAVKVITPMDGTPAAKAGMKSGDFIMSIDSKSMEGLSLNDAVARMRGDAGSKITLGVVRPGRDKPFDVTMTREVIHIQIVRSALYGNVGYIRVSSFNEQTNADLQAAYAKLKRQAGGKLSGLILDLRNNPGGLLDQAEDVCEDFITSGEIVSTRARHPEESQRIDAHGADITNGEPLLVLINQGSASASEIVAGALQDHQRSITLGERSFGKGSVQTLFAFPGNGAIRLTTARYYTPSGRSIQGLGITPDVSVQEDRTDTSRFMPREADLDHIIKNQGGTQSKPPARADLPSIVRTIPDKPPADWPQFDLTKPSTDFQLQQGLKVIQAMIAQHGHAATR